MSLNRIGPGEVDHNAFWDHRACGVFFYFVTKHNLIV